MIDWIRVESPLMVREMACEFDCIYSLYAHPLYVKPSSRHPETHVVCAKVNEYVQHDVDENDSRNCLFVWIPSLDVTERVSLKVRKRPSVAQGLYSPDEWDSFEVNEQ
jgi:hypothetical protein